MPFKIITSSPEQTVELGKRLGGTLKPGDFVALIGELGSGKTTFIQGLGKGLGVSSVMTSPTFIIISEYKGDLPVYHFDLYRLKDLEELFNLGYEEYFYGDGVAIIEWAEKVESLLPEKRLEVRLKYLSDREREITLIPKGERYEILLKDIL
ncbi:MAG: tRNA (adenosine(37)-N6)-threonylcarbamoyltransferase complex ATPase subunit type 1 TsaE [Candidatus Edwardsbacteria bacterium]